MLALVLAMVTVLSSIVGTARLANASPTSTSAQHTRYSGKILFKGLYFGRGPVAKLFPEYYKEFPKANSKAISLENSLMRKIGSDDPSFFRTFHREIYSGSRVEVQQALTTGSHKLLNALANQLHVSPTAIENGKVGYVEDANRQPGAVVFVWVAANYVVATEAVAVAAAALFVGAVHHPSLSSEDSIQEARFVNDVVTTLGTS